jgi:pimeloyl-ACP methyl ester carboxylesterase
MTAAMTEGQYALLSNGMRLHYASAGQAGAPLMLFLHGFPEFWWAWHAQLPEFGQDHFAVAPDLRGYNLSDQPAEVSAYRAKHLVEDLSLLIAHLGYRQCVLVAHDWGGALAWNLALAQPQLVSKLIIINAPHPWLFWRALKHDSQQQAASAYMNWLRQPQAEAMLAEHDFERMDKLLAGAGQMPPWYEPQVRAKYRAAWSHGLRGPLNYYRASPLFPPAPDQPGAAALDLRAEDFVVKVPTRVIWGESDIALPRSLLDDLSQVVQDLVVERIADGTHWVVHEQPQRVNSLIRGFL